MATSEASTEEIVDRMRIQELIYGYNNCIDSESYDEIPCFFVKNGIFEGLTGRVNISTDLAEFVEGIRTMRANGFAHMRHFTTNIQIQIKKDRAVANSFMLVTSIGSDGALRIAATGTFADKLLRSSDGWRFEQRVARVDGG